MQPKENVVKMTDKEISYIPQPDPCFYTGGSVYKHLQTIIKSGKFFPTWIAGPKGCGKTSTVKQICAEEKREFIRVNFNQETDEMELLGMIGLQNGDTYFKEGPVVEALRRGAVLMLDEVDVAHPNKVLCLQSVLEGSGVFVKAINEHVYPAPGFQIFATSNTKGRGCDTGEYIGTNIMNGAFLDRFAATVDQTYPSKEEEAKLLQYYYARFIWQDKGKEADDLSNRDLKHAEEFIRRLCIWAEHIRESFDKGAVEEVISTRSLINIVNCYSIFENEELSIRMCCNRYGAATAEAFVSDYDKLFDSLKSSDKDDEVMNEFIDDELSVL